MPKGGLRREEYLLFRLIGSFAKSERRQIAERVGLGRRVKASRKGYARGYAHGEARLAPEAGQAKTPWGKTGPLISVLPLKLADEALLTQVYKARGERRKESRVVEIGIETPVAYRGDIDLFIPATVDVPGFAKAYK